MVFRKIFGHPEVPGVRNRSVTIRVEVGGKTHVQTYDDLDMALLRFPQYLADLNALYARQLENEQGQD